MSERIQFERQKRLLSKISIKSSNYSGTRSQNSRPGAVNQDIITAVSFIKRRSADGDFVADTATQTLILYLWAGIDAERDLRLLKVLLAGHSVYWVKGISWIPRTGELNKLAGLALQEKTHSLACKACSATGKSLQRSDDWEGLKMANCQSCGGDGRKPWSKSLLARIWGVSPSTWGEIWHPRYTRMTDMIDRMEENGLSQLSKGL